VSGNRSRNYRKFVETVAAVFAGGGVFSRLCGCTVSETLSPRPVRKGMGTGRKNGSLKVLLGTVLAAAVIVLFVPEASAGTATGSLTVTATVNSTCSVSSGGGSLSFGVYDPVAANATTPLTQTGSFQIQCTNGTSARILLGQGSYPGSGSTDASPVRNMAINGTGALNYQLYTGPDRGTVWDNQTGVLQTATGLVQTIDVYGTIFAGQNVAAGNYTDTVVISISY